MSQISFFDCNCFFGMRGVVNPGSFYKLEDLKIKMKQYGIGKAIVYHSMAREYDPAIGNEMLMDNMQDSDMFIPAWVIMHHHTNEFPNPYDLEEKMKDNSIKAVRMFPAPTEQNYCISEWNCGELFSMLEALRIPLFLSLDQLKWDELYQLCSNHVDLNIVLTDVNFRINRDLFSLLKKFSNVYIETSGYKVFQGIEDVCQKFGAYRLLFGSGMPEYSGGAAVCMINYAKVTDEEKKMIASDNLDNLLRGVQYG